MVLREDPERGRRPRDLAQLLLFVFSGRGGRPGWGRHPRAARRQARPENTSKSRVVEALGRRPRGGDKERGEQR